ncbi:alginate O-acetyltransferase AlgX-related protein, partial [Bacillus sp. GMa5/2]
MKKFQNLTLIMGFLTVIFGVGIWTAKVILIDKKTFSEFENRNLAIRPAVNASTIKTGELFKGIETHFTDHVGPRDLFLESYIKFQLSMNRTFVNNIHVTNDQFIFNRPNMENHLNDVDAGVQELNTLKKDFPQTEFYFSLVPSKQTALQYKLPSYLNLGYEQILRDHLAEKLTATKFPIIDVLPMFKERFTNEKLERMYLTTDHHWNMEGAFYAYEDTMNFINSHSNKYKGQPIKKDNYTINWEKPKGKFVGSWNNQLYRLIDTSSVQIPYVHYNFGESWDDYTVYYGAIKDDTAKESMTQFYGKEKDIPAPGYANVYQTDFPEINIINTKADNDLHLVILKDSYADATYPLFARNFAKTTFIDPRYTQGKSVKQQLE